MPEELFSAPGAGPISGQVTERVRVMAARVLPLSAHEAGIALIDFDIVTITWVREDGNIVPVLGLVIIFDGPDDEGPSARLFQWVMVNSWYPELGFIKERADEVCAAAAKVHAALSAQKQAREAASNGKPPVVPGAGLKKIWLPGEGPPGGVPRVTGG